MNYGTQRNVLKYFSIATIVMGLGCSSEEKEETTTAPTTTAGSFADANTVITASCSASGCHGKTGAGSTIYQDNETNVKKDKAKIDASIAKAKGADGFMPKNGNALSDADKKKITDFK